MRTTTLSTRWRTYDLTLVLGFLAVGISSLFYSYEYLLRISPSVMYSDLMDHYQINDYGLASLVAWYYYIYSPMQLPVGMLADGFGPHRILLFACLCCSIGCYLFVCTDTLSVGIMGRFLVGLGSAFAFVGVLKLATICLPERYFAVIAGGTMALGQLGAFMGDLLLTKTIHIYGMVVANVQMSLVGFVILAVMMLVFQLQKHYGTCAKQTKELKIASSKEVFEQLLEIITNPQLWITSAIGFFLCVPVAVFAEFVGIDFLKTVYELSSQQAAFCNSLFFMGMAVGGLILPQVSNRIGSRLLPLRVGCSMTAVLLFSVLVEGFHTITTLKSTIFIMGFFNSAKVMVFPIAKDLATNKSAGTAVALVNMVVMLSGIVFQPLTGYLLNAYALSPFVHVKQDYYSALIYMPIAVLVVLPLSYCLADSTKKYKEVEYAIVD